MTQTVSLLGRWDWGGGLVVEDAHLDATDEETAARVDRRVSSNAWAGTFEVPTVMAAARAAYLEYAPEYVRFFDPVTDKYVRLDEDDFTDEELGL
ncbi:hypothetical protein [Streptomyces sp. CBMA156]|uniref:hypothetical protein n=1 Tax=Streptomyces sp. CBMA156 TaxID=1930280 RepID=UPI001661FE1A|nr:hypothetical protein [Streptomyces sp. CBMA156]MBD0670037.1 hypothetical protein [Streptomyces sp. CBMA156]